MHAKLHTHGGMEGVVIATPEVSHFSIKDNYHDFIVMGCDGIFDKLESSAVMSVAWDTIKRSKASTSTAQLSGKVTDAVIKEAA
jgi:serine/threonine protein phosphatase PrpC